MCQVTSRRVASGTEAPGVLVLVCPHQAAATSSQDGCSSRRAFQLMGRAGPSFKGLFSKLHTQPSLAPHWPGLVTLLEDAGKCGLDTCPRAQCD